MMTELVGFLATGLLVANTAGNLSSASKVERWGMGAATTCLTVAFGLMGWIFLALERVA